MGPSRRTCGNASRRHVDRCDARVSDQFSASEHRRRVRREPRDDRVGRDGARAGRRTSRRAGLAGHLRAERDGARLRLHACAGADMERFRAHHLHPARPRLERDSLGRGSARRGRDGHDAPGRPARRHARPRRSRARAPCRRRRVGRDHRRVEPHRMGTRRAGRARSHPRSGRSNPRRRSRACTPPPDRRQWMGHRLARDVALQVVRPARRHPRVAAGAAPRCRALPCAARRLRRSRPVGDGHEVVRGDRRHRRRRVVHGRDDVDRGDGGGGRAARAARDRAQGDPRRRRPRCR